MFNIFKVPHIVKKLKKNCTETCLSLFTDINFFLVLCMAIVFNATLSQKRKCSTGNFTQNMVIMIGVTGSQRSSPASLPDFAGYFHCVDPQPSTFHKAPATQKSKENYEAIYCTSNNPCKKFKWQTS